MIWSTDFLPNGERTHMSDCEQCRSEPFCFYPYKPTECVGLRKFWTAERRAEWDKKQEPSSQGKRADEVKP